MRKKKFLKKKKELKRYIKQWLKNIKNTKYTDFYEKETDELILMSFEMQLEQLLKYKATLYKVKE